MDALILHDSEVSEDPDIKMRGIRVMFHESQYNYQTDINGTRKSIGDYFRGAQLNVASFPNEVMRTPYRIEFLPKTDEEPTIVLELGAKMVDRLKAIASKLDDAQNGNSDTLYDARSDLQDVIEDLEE